MTDIFWCGLASAEILKRLWAVRQLPDHVLFHICGICQFCWTNIIWILVSTCIMLVLAENQQSHMLQLNCWLLTDETSFNVLSTENAVTEESHSAQHSYSDSRHMLKQSVYQCPMCDHMTMSLKLLVNHITKHKPQCGQSGSELPAPRPRHLCSECGKEFAVAAVFASHVRVIHRGQFLFCSFNIITLQQMLQLQLDSKEMCMKQHSVQQDWFNSFFSRTPWVWWYDLKLLQYGIGCILSKTMAGARTRWVLHARGARHSKWYVIALLDVSGVEENGR